MVCSNFLHCSEYTPNLPFVLLINVATTALGFQTSLPISTISKLNTVNFQISASNDLVNSLVEHVGFYKFNIRS